MTKILLIHILKDWRLNMDKRKPIRLDWKVAGSNSAVGHGYLWTFCGRQNRPAMLGTGWSDHQQRKKARNDQINSRHHENESIRALNHSRLLSFCDQKYMQKANYQLLKDALLRKDSIEKYFGDWNDYRNCM